MRKILALLATIVGALACDDTNDMTNLEQTDGGSDGGGAEAEPAYVFATQVFSDDVSQVYVSFHRSLDDLDPERVLDEGYELQSVANFEAIEGKLYVSGGESPTITQYTVNEELEWEERETISFANYGFSDNANWWRQYIVGRDKVMLPFDTVGRIAWTPSTMEIDGEVTDSALALEVDGLGVYNDGGNPNSTRFTDGKPMQPFYTWGGPDEMYGPTSFVVTYDEDLEELETLEIPCPDLEMTSRAEDGTTYFGNMWHSGLYALFGKGLAPCIARVTPDGGLDEDFITDLTDLTGGRYTQAFTYLRDGLAIANVLHHEETGIDFDGEYNAELEYMLLEGGYIHAWLFDLENDTAKEIEGIETALTQRPNTVVIDDRIFMLAVDPEFAFTDVYEISDDAVATKLFEVPGSAVGWQRLR